MAIVFFIILIFLLGLFCGVWLTLPQKKSWWADKFIGLVKKYTNTESK